MISVGSGRSSNSWVDGFVSSTMIAQARRSWDSRRDESVGRSMTEGVGLYGGELRASRALMSSSDAIFWSYVSIGSSLHLDDEYAIFSTNTPSAHLT